MTVHETAGIHRSIESDNQHKRRCTSMLPERTRSTARRSTPTQGQCSRGVFPGDQYASHALMRFCCAIAKSEPKTFGEATAQSQGPTRGPPSKHNKTAAASEEAARATLTSRVPTVRSPKDLNLTPYGGFHNSLSPSRLQFAELVGPWKLQIVSPMLFSPAREAESGRGSPARGGTSNR